MISVHLHPCMFQLKNRSLSGNFNQEPHHIAQLGPTSKTSQETSMARLKHIPSYRSSKFPPCAPSQTPVSHSIPSRPLLHTHPTTHINHPPSLLPLSPPLLHFTHGIYQAALDSHTGHTAQVFKAGSHSRVQTWMHSCIQSCTGVNNRL